MTNWITHTTFRVIAKGYEVINVDDVLDILDATEIDDEPVSIGVLALQNADLVDYESIGGSYHLKARMTAKGWAVAGDKPMWMA